MSVKSMATNSGDALNLDDGSPPSIPSVLFPTVNPSVPSASSLAPSPMSSPTLWNKPWSVKLPLTSRQSLDEYRAYVDALKLDPYTDEWCRMMQPILDYHDQDYDDDGPGGGSGEDLTGRFRLAYHRGGSALFRRGMATMKPLSLPFYFGLFLWALAVVPRVIGFSSRPPATNSNRIDVDSDERLYRVNLSRATGIEWGTDLSFAFVNVRALDPTGDAALSGVINVGDQLCELQAVGQQEDEDDTEPINLVGAPFDFVMEAFATLDKTITNVELVFFRGTKDELKAAAKGGGGAATEPEVITVTVIENKDSETEKVHTFTAPAGVNIRELCVDNGINVYQSITRWTNCKGKQLCGTCIVNIPEGGPNTNRKSMDEASTLRENPETYRLSCVSFAYGDVTIETFPPIKAAQWTR